MTHRRTISTLAAAGASALALPLLTTVAAAPAHAAPPDPADRHIAWTGWDSPQDFAAGTGRGTVVRHGDLVMGGPAGGPHRRGSASWVSPVVEPGFDLTRLVSSWNATTPDGTWLRVQVRGTADTGERTRWYTMGRWASGDDGFRRRSVDGQGDDLADVATDTLMTEGDHTLTDWQLRVTFFREAGTHRTPRLSLVGAMASALPEEEAAPTSPSGGAEGLVLDVPAYSQELHVGEYPQWDGGGEAWCSATSTAMVLDYWGAGPSRREMRWVDPAYADPQVDYAARAVYDYTYEGTGNWSFNVAYAGSRGLESFVTRLRSLTEAEQFIKAGIPLVTSLSFGPGELPGAGYSTDGHLMVIVGFDESGDVVVNDPASHKVPDNAQVRTTYDRERFEAAWANSGRTTYVMRPAWVPLPPAPAEPNW